MRGSAGVSNGTLKSGTSYYGGLAANGLESFQMFASAGQGFMIFNSSAYGTSVSLYKPDGSIMGTTGNGYTGTAATTGNYTVVMQAGFITDSGSYRMDYLKGAGDVSRGLLTTGVPRGASLQAHGIESYQFTGVSGEYRERRDVGGFFGARGSLYAQWRPTGPALAVFR